MHCWYSSRRATSRLILRVGLGRESNKLRVSPSLIFSLGAREQSGTSIFGGSRETAAPESIRRAQTHTIMKKTNNSPSDADGTSSYKEFPEAVRHDFELKSGRNLSYYTFETSATSNETPKPVLYFHGFPGAGKEGAVCASEVADAGGKLFAVDRPGFGHSDAHHFSLTDPDEQVQAFVDDLWEYIADQKWTSFSVIAVSGGGPSALAFLTSYLDTRSNDSQVPQLDAVSLAAAVFCSAGTEGMMKTNETLLNLATSQDKLLSRFALNAMFAAPIT